MKRPENDVYIYLEQRQHGNWRKAISFSPIASWNWTHTKVTPISILAQKYSLFAPYWQSQFYIDFPASFRE